MVILEYTRCIYFVYTRIYIQEGIKKRITRLSLGIQEGFLKEETSELNSENKINCIQMKKDVKGISGTTTKMSKVQMCETMWCVLKARGSLMRLDVLYQAEQVKVRLKDWKRSGHGGGL